MNSISEIVCTKCLVYINMRPNTRTIMTAALIKFYKRENRDIDIDTIVVKDYEEALRYAQAVHRVHGWEIRDIKLRVEEPIKVHKL